MQPLSSDNRQPSAQLDSPPNSPMHEAGLRAPLEDNRIADELEAKSIAWNVARIVRLSSGRYAILTHYRAGALDIIKVGTLEASRDKNKCLSNS